MVQPNIKIYTVKYIDSKIYSNIRNRINDLGKQKKTEISFNFEEQYFDIKGRSQQACDDTSYIMEENLLPHLNSMLDEFKFQGTFEDIDDLDVAEAVRTNTSTLSNTFTYDMKVAPGKAFDFEGVDRSSPSEQQFNDFYETESDDESKEHGKEYRETFTFAKNVPNPREILMGPVINNSKPADYLRIVGNDTDTECSLIDRQVEIVGKSEENVKEALQRFRNLQTFYKRRKRATVIVPCVHYPSESTEFGLYFCSLDRYAQQAFVDVLSPPASPLFVIIPTFKNNQGKYQKPKDMLEGPPQNGRIQQQYVQQQRQQQEQEISLEERMRLASLEYSGRKSFGNSNSGLAPDQRPLWGENKTFVTHASASTRPAPTPPKSYVQPPKKEPKEEFPALGGGSNTPKVMPKKAPVRKVMRITNQKSAMGTSSIPKNIQQSVKDYNFHNIKTALADGLSGVRGFKGDIKMSAKMGKILWSQVPADTQKQVWQFQDLRDILMNEKKIRPNFNDVTTFSDEVITRISSVLPQPYSKSAYYEIHARARNQPVAPYQNVVMHINQGIVEFKKIVTGVNKITEIDWVSLDRKFDFRLMLSTEETTRSDVRPYSTFHKKISISPVTRQITYENVPDFLEVDYILLKQKTRYRVHFPFVVEITQVEKLPLIQQRFDGYGIDKILGDTGKGQVWYDLEIFYSTFDEIFKENNDLPAGKLASWNVEDVLGSQDEALTEYIRCLLLIIEKSEKKL